MFDELENILQYNIIKRLEDRKVIFWENGKPVTLKIDKGKFTTEKVMGWGTLIRYPANTERPYSILVFVHFLENETNKLIRQNKIKIKNVNDYEKVYHEVRENWDIKHEPRRFYDNYLRRNSFKEGLLSGRIRK